MSREAGFGEEAKEREKKQFSSDQLGSAGVEFQILEIGFKQHPTQ